jgi:hypothetical protein
MKAEVVTELIISAVVLLILISAGVVITKAFFANSLSGGGEGTFNDFVDAVNSVEEKSPPKRFLSRLGENEFIVGKDAVWDEGAVVAFGDQIHSGSVIKFSVVYPACNSRACLCIWNSKDFSKKPVKCEIFEKLAGFSWKSGSVNKGNIKFVGGAYYLVLSGGVGGSRVIEASKDHVRFIVVSESS